MTRKCILRRVINRREQGCGGVDPLSAFRGIELYRVSVLLERYHAIHGRVCFAVTIHVSDQHAWSFL